jgi:superfamily I DNA/RNA helicase
VERPTPPKPALFAGMSDDDLLAYGVPTEWLDDVRQANENTILELADRLPGEAAEALLELATGGTPKVPQPVAADTDPFEHPDAQRRFRVMTNVEELQRALDYPWEKWTVFLHPAQRDLVERSYGGPARVSGSAGTGKTVVALHRAVFLARKHRDARLLLTTFSNTLADALRAKLRRLIGNEPRVFERIEVHSIVDVGTRLYAACLSEPRLADDTTVRRMLADASAKAETHRFSGHFLWTEWNEVVDAWQLDSWEAYRDVARLGRKTRLGEHQRKLLWSIFEQVRQELAGRDLMTSATMFARVTEHLTRNSARPYEFAVVDEAQDIGVPQLRFLAALGAPSEDGLFFAGDLGQRIFQPPFSWKSLGVDVRGRSRTLRINYRTSHQIRRQADHLLPPELSDVDGNAENRQGTVSVFNGPDPLIKVCDTKDHEAKAVAAWLSERQADGLQPHEIGVFVRSAAQLPRARGAVEAARLKALELQNSFETQVGHVSVCTMHLAKGLEFRAVVVMACDDEIIPLQQRIEAVADDADLEEVYNTERHLLYVACTRARDYLLVTGTDPASEFLDDLRT